MHRYPFDSGLRPPLAAIRLWRWWVVVFARRLPIESPVACMGFSIIFLLTAIYLLPGLEPWARVSPLIAEAFEGAPHGWRCLRIMAWASMAAAYAGAWMFQARCLQICYPDYYDPYAMD